LEEREKKHFAQKARDTDKEEEEEIPRLENRKADKEKKVHEKEADEDIDADDSDSSDGNSDSGSESDKDETAELMREIEKIKQERQTDLQKKAAEKEQVEQEEQARVVQLGNPLLNSQTANFNVKKRWYEDTVFKNQARDEPQPKKRFINDTLRNDFHRKFLAKYIQ